jgi:Fanconi anemia group M protein
MKPKPLLDIFSKSKKRKPKEKPLIIVDHQEKNSLLISELISLGFEIEFTRLKVADYLVRGVAIERKTISDFIGSIKNKRLLRQLEELQQYEKKLLIIEGIYEQELYVDSVEVEGMHANAIRGFLLSVLLNFKVPIIFTKDYQDTAKFIDVLSRKKNTRDIGLNVSKKTLNNQERTQFILEGFPGVGPKTAKNLLGKFKTLKNIFNASEDELEKILGKKAKAFVKIIGDDYSSK